MAKFEVSIIINKPANIITKALNNPNNAPYWQTNLEKFEVVKGGPNQVGSIGRLHYSQKGSKYVMKDKLLECEPGKRYLSEVSGEALTARVETTLEPENGKTKMTIKWEGKAKALPLKILFLFIKGKMTQQAQKELDAFKRLIENRGIDFSKSQLANKQ